MKHASKYGVSNIWGHVLKFMNLLHILANVVGSYGGKFQNEEMIENG